MSGRKTLLTAALLLFVAGSGALLVADESLDGYGVFFPPLTAAVLYGALVGMFRRQGVVGIPALLSASIPLAGAALSGLLITQDPGGICEFWDGFLLPIPVVCVCGTALNFLSRRASASP